MEYAKDTRGKSVMMKTLQTTIIALLLAMFTGMAWAAQTITYYHLDALGSPVATTNGQGNVVWREAYEPYGSRIRNEAASSSNNVWYTGKQEDSRAGLSYFGARWYDPVIGRFMGIDPVGFKEDNPQTFNRFAYANNNPYLYVDPDGREIKSTRVGTSTSIRFTGVMIDRTGTLSKGQLAGLAARMKNQIQSSFAGSSGANNWSTFATIDVGAPGDTLNGRHEINIQPASGFSNPRVLGNVDKIGGSHININENLRGLSPSNSNTNASFERTAAHEFGHAAGLVHQSGGLMHQTRISNSLNINKSQIDTVHKNNK